MGTRSDQVRLARENDWEKVTSVFGRGEYYRNPDCFAGYAGDADCTCVPLEEPLSEQPAVNTAELVDNNPKTRQGALKAPLHLVPPSAEFYLAEALGDGAAKYGPYNWREEKITTSVYIGAMKRHMAAFVDGEDNAADSGVHHLAHLMACCALILDADSIGMLVDDRPAKGGSVALMDAYHEKRKGEGV